MKKKILVVAVHPDDETLGCGGSLLKHKANGDEINWLICTTIDKDQNYYQTREKEINKVSKLYAFNSVHSLLLKTTRIDDIEIPYIEASNIEESTKHTSDELIKC